ncbi:hypothetical protein R1flu_014494 [Riccia fluitans]|uniref:Uncharacterized protein n=1 Tax=Riccia fluitans TaxID=41844 RepID=A0ABD1YG95_9MARC
MQYTRNVQQRLRKEGQIYQVNDSMSVRQWIEQNPESVILYQEQDTTRNQPFILVFAAPWMQSKFVKEAQVPTDNTHVVQSVSTRKSWFVGFD